MEIQKTISAIANVFCTFFLLRYFGTESKGISVIIVGGGISGLAAANSLQARGAKVIILEAKNRIGGRLYTDNVLGAPFEVGAGWIHGPSNRNPIKKLANKIKSKTFVTDDNNYVLFDNDRNFQKTHEKWESILSYFGKE